MGRIVVTEFVSLDGVMEDPGGSERHRHGGWSFAFERTEAAGQFKVDELMAADAQLLGRVTYEGFAAAWPERSGDPFSDRFNEMPKYVVSSTLTDPTWNNSTVISYDDVRALKERTDRDLLVAGSAQLTQALIADDLVDELRLMVFPVLLGEGKRVFDATATDKKTWHLVSTQQTGQAQLLVLHPARE